MKKVRVRYAPSPTGQLHIGNARTALFNWLFAKHNNGDFIIRIEDTDLSRNIEGGEISQMNNLSWLGINWDESIDKDGKFGPYRQMERLDIYKKYVDILIEKNLAYKCFCTEEELEIQREEQIKNGKMPAYNGTCKNKQDQNGEYSIRFKVPFNKDYTWKDLVKGDMKINSNDISGDWVIMKKNGIPTYNFACAIDDSLMEISHVLRGEDHLSNTPKQMMIMDALEFDYPIYGHMTLIVNENNKKLSKRDESIIQFIEQYKDLGYSNNAMFNFISLLGWSPNSEEEIFSSEELVKIFDENRLSKSPAKFDKDKLKWINNRYIKNMDFDEYALLTLKFLREEYSNLDTKDNKWINKLLELYKDEISYGKEIVEISKIFFNETIKLEKEELEFLKSDIDIKNTLNVFKEEISNSKSLELDDIKQIINNTKEKSGAKGKMLFMPIRIAISGQMHGPDLNDTIYLLGKENIINRIDEITISI